jgi:HKD family nuclease
MIITKENNIIVTAGNNAIITNEGSNTLKRHLEELIPNSKEVKILVACFEFSGIAELYKSLKELYSKGELSQEHIKILVGLHETDEDIAEPDYEENYELYANEDESKSIERKDIFVQSFANSIIKFMKTALANKELSKEEAYDIFELFIKLLKEKTMVIKKTMKPNASVIYLIKTKERPSPRILKPSSNIFICGSSNLSRKGLVTQKEMNVKSTERIQFRKSEKHFDKLWETAIPLSEKDIEKLEKAGSKFFANYPTSA